MPTGFHKIRFRHPEPSEGSLTKKRGGFLGYCLRMTITGVGAFFWAKQVLAKHCPPATKRVCLHNPLGENVDISVVIARLIQGFLGITGTIALAIFIYGGILLLTSAGNPDKVKKGKDALLWTAIALVIIFSSYALVNFIITGLTRPK